MLEVCLVGRGAGWGCQEEFIVFLVDIFRRYVQRGRLNSSRQEWVEDQAGTPCYSTLKLSTRRRLFGGAEQFDVCQGAGGHKLQNGLRFWCPCGR